MGEVLGNVMSDSDAIFREIVAAEFPTAGLSGNEVEYAEVPSVLHAGEYERPLARMAFTGFEVEDRPDTPFIRPHPPKPDPTPKPTAPPAERKPTVR